VKINNYRLSFPNLPVAVSGFWGLGKTGGFLGSNPTLSDRQINPN
jgi:hypothetical protein